MQLNRVLTDSAAKERKCATGVVKTEIYEYVASKPPAGACGGGESLPAALTGGGPPLRTTAGRRQRPAKAITRGGRRRRAGEGAERGPASRLSGCAPLRCRDPARRTDLTLGDGARPLATRWGERIKKSACPTTRVTRSTAIPLERRVSDESETSQRTPSPTSERPQWRRRCPPRRTRGPRGRSHGGDAAAAATVQAWWSTSWPAAAAPSQQMPAATGECACARRCRQERGGAGRGVPRPARNGGGTGGSPCDPHWPSHLRLTADEPPAGGAYASVVRGGDCQAVVEEHVCPPLTRWRPSLPPTKVLRTKRELLRWWRWLYHGRSCPPREGAARGGPNGFRSRDRQPPSLPPGGSGPAPA